MGGSMGSRGTEAMKDRTRGDEGFTLLEIMVVLFVITLIAIIVTPRLSFHRSNGLGKVSRRLVQEFKILHWEALSEQRMVRLEYDLDRNRFTATVLDPSGTIQPLHLPGVHDFSLPEKVRITRVKVLHEGTVSDGKTFTQFFPSGSVEPTRITLSDKEGNRMTLTVKPYTGRVRVMKGDVPENRSAPIFYGPPSGEIPSLQGRAGGQ